MNPNTLAKLRSLPNPRYNPLWPEGTKQPLTKPLAEYFFSLISTCDTSLLQLLRDHPELPPFKQLDSWRAGKAWFNEGWKKARQNQAHFLANKCLELANNACPKTAHVARVRFDIYRWFAAKLHPLCYGDKPAPPQQTTNVTVGVAVSAERISEIRAKLEQTRAAYLTTSKAKQSTERHLLSPTDGSINGAPSQRDQRK